MHLRSFSLVLFALAAARVAAPAETHPFSVDDMLAMDRLSDPRVSPDGTQVVFTVRTTDMEANRGRHDLYLAAADGSWLRRLTTHPADDHQGRWAPDGGTVYFISTRSGSAQAWKISVAGGEAEQVTRLPLDVDALEVVPGGDRLVLAMAVLPGRSPDETKAALEARGARKESALVFESLFVRHWDTWSDGTRNHLFAYDLADGRALDLMREMDADCPTKPFGGSEDYDISPDGRRLVFSARDVGREEAWSTNFDLFEVDLTPGAAAAAPKPLTKNPAWDAQPRFSPDGSRLAYLAMSRAGFEADRFDVVLRELASGRETRHVLRGEDGARGDRSPDSLAWLSSGAGLVMTADHLGQHPVFLLDAASGRSRTLVATGHSLSPRPLPGGGVVFLRDSLLGPAELEALDLTDGATPRRITHLNDAKVAAARFGEPVQFSFEGANGNTVHAYLVKPVDFAEGRSYPVAFLIHGGHQGSFGNDFHYRWNPQAYAGAGYAALMIDFHGSTGYGQAFTDAIRGDWGGAPFEDLRRGLDAALARFPFLDGTRVAALGASYGGYMVNWIAGQPFASRFKCLVTHDGNLDEHAAYFTTEELWFPEWEHGGPPWVNPDAYAKHNPVNFVRNWKTPTLVSHGGKDYRVVDTSGLATFTALQRRGVPSKLVYFPDENHWVLKPHNSRFWHQTVIDWLDRWLR